MLYLFFGENDYLIKQAVNKLSQGFAETKLFDFTDLTREISELMNLPDLLSQQSLFAQKTLFILRGFLKNADKKELENLLRFIHTTSYKQMETDIVFCEEKLDQRLKIVKWLKENAQVKEFRELRKPEVRKWIEEQIKLSSCQAACPVGEAVFGVKLEAVDELLRLHGSNLWALENELKKLTSYAQKREITLEDVKKLCVPSVEENIFAFTDAIALRNKKGAAELFESLLSQQQDPWYLFAMIVRQFRLLILMKSAGKLLKTHPFVVQKTREQAKLWELPELKKIYQQLLDIDVACKTGKGDLKTELSLLITCL